MIFGKELPNGWSVVRLADVCREITVGYVGPMADKYQPTGVPFLRSQNILAFGLSLADIKFIPAEFHAKIKKSALFPGDVAIVRTGYPGTACVIPFSLTGANCSDLVIARPGEKLNSWFLAAILNSSWGRSSVAGNLVGVAQQHFNVGAAKMMEIALPPIEEQRRIASILSAYDDLIENNTRRIAILEEMARRLYEEWFVRFRFPGHAGVRLLESELGLVPQGWQRRSLDTFGEVITGKTPSKANPDFYGDDIPFVKTPDMHGNAFVLVSGESLSLAGAKSQSKKTLPPGSLCVSCIGTIGVVSITTEPCQTNQQINSIVLSDVVAREFLFLRLKDAKKTLENLGANGATMGNVNKSNFAAMEITAPPLNLLVRFHEAAEPMFNLMRALARKNQNLRTTRDLLLPKVISGELDVSTLPEAFHEPPTL